MFLQADRFSCGAVALSNALLSVGRKVPVAACARLAKTTPVMGTTDAGMRRAIKDLGFRSTTLSTVDSAPQAIAALRGCLVVGQPAVLAFDKNEHWVAAVGILGERVAIADSADGDLVILMSPSTLARRWVSRQKGRDIYFGIAVVSP